MPGFNEWRLTNVYAQKQAGYVVATVTLPLGDLSSWQMRELARMDIREHEALVHEDIAVTTAGS